MGDYSGDRHDKYNMKIIRLAAIAALLLPGSALCYDDDLEAPDADIYLELQGLRTDFSDVGGDHETGFRARLGLNLNDARLGSWNWRFEGALTQLGSSEAESRTIRDDFPTLGDTQTEVTTVDTRVHGFEIGLRLYDNELFFVRTGGFLYSLKTKTETLITIDAVPDPDPAPFSTSDSSSDSGIAPYAGLGVELPILDASTKVIVEYDYMNIDSTDFHSIGAGVQFVF